MKDLPQRLPQPVFSRSFGTGSREMLAVHCSLAHSGTWRGLAEAMDGQVAITAFDMLSQGAVRIGTAMEIIRTEMSMQDCLCCRMRLLI